MENAKIAFDDMYNQYEKILKTGFYPARGSTGFTEQNLVHYYTNALVQVINKALIENGKESDAFAWLEFPWKGNKEHIDAVVISKNNNSIHYIEAKRLSVGKEKFGSLSRDIKRIQDRYKDEKHFSDILKHHKIDISKFKHYIVALADIWVTEQPKNKTGIHFTKNIYDSWQKNANLSDIFIKHTHLANLLQNSQFTSYKEFTSLQNYKFLFAIQPLQD